MNRLITATALLLFNLGVLLAQPRFKGGDEALNYFLKQNLIYPDYSQQNCISGTIQVSFNVNKAGIVHNIKVYKGLGIDLDDEALRVLRMTSGKWLVSDNFDPNFTMIIPITFSAQDTHCQTITGQNIAAAIQAYQSRNTLVDAVTNYYTNKYLGKADTSKEKDIVALKQQLGFDDDYTDRILAEAKKKLNQGDKEGACDQWLFIRNTGSNKADAMLAQYCSK